MGVEISMDNISSKVFDNFKKITPALFSLVILSGLVLFLPENILAKMGLNNLPDLVKVIIGIIFLLCSSLIVTIVLFSCFESWRKKRKQKQFQINQRKKLEQLSNSQKRIIFDLMRSDDKSIQLEANSGDTQYLLANRFIHQPTQAMSLGFNNEMELIYIPEPWLMDLYNSNPEIFA